MKHIVIKDDKIVATTDNYRTAVRAMVERDGHRLRVVPTPAEMEALQCPSRSVTHDAEAHMFHVKQRGVPVTYHEPAIHREYEVLAGLAKQELEHTL
jgi:hypothetical protein